MLTRCCPSLTPFSTFEVYMYRPRLSNHLAIVSGSQEDRRDPEEEVEDDKLSQEEPLTLCWQCGELTELALLSLFIIFLRPLGLVTIGPVCTVGLGAFTTVCITILPAGLHS